jgi:hypothetical protein
MGLASEQYTGLFRRVSVYQGLIHSFHTSYTGDSNGEVSTALLLTNYSSLIGSFSKHPPFDLLLVHPNNHNRQHYRLASSYKLRLTSSVDRSTVTRYIAASSR